MFLILMIVGLVGLLCCSGSGARDGEMTRGRLRAEEAKQLAADTKHSGWYRYNPARPRNSEKMDAREFQLSQWNTEHRGKQTP